MQHGLEETLNCSLAARSHGTSRDSSARIKEYKKRWKLKQTRSKQRYSTCCTTREKTDNSDFTPPSVRIIPATKYRELDYDIKHHKQEDKKKTPGCKETEKLAFEEDNCLPWDKYATDSPSILPTPSHNVIPPDCFHLITPSVWQSSTSRTGEIVEQGASEDLVASMHSESMTAGGGEVKPQIMTHNFSAVNTLFSQCQLPLSSCVTGKISCHMSHSQSKRANSFTPVITPDFDDETYRFQFSCPGVYQCTVTGLVFHMEGEGDVVYRTVPWNRRLLSKHHKKPAGPLFDIKCVQQSVCQLHVPHCEILSTGGFQFLSVAHVTDEGIEFIRPQKITETHVVINITGFSGYGNVKDEDCPPDPVRALVLLFYRPPEDPDPESLINVLLVPRNIVVRDVQRTRRKLIGDEIYIDKPPHCKLQPNQVYTLSTCPQNCSVKIEPPDAEFDEEFHSSYFTTFQVILKTTMKKIMLSLKQKSSSNTVWKREVCLPSTKKGNSCAQCALNPSPNQRLRNIQSPMSTGNRKSSEEKLLDVRSRFVDGISEPVLKCLLDKLLEKKVMNDSERESMNEKQNKRDKARFVIDTVRKKGEAASSEMIDFLCEVDTFLCGHLGLM